MDRKAVRSAEQAPDRHADGVEEEVDPGLALVVALVGVELQLPVAALGVEREELLARGALDRAADAVGAAELDRALELAVGPHVVQVDDRVGVHEREAEDLE